MYRVLRSAHRVQAQWQLHNRAQFNLLNYRRVAEALIQSAAMYSIASVSLFVTILVTPNIGYPACLAAFSPYIVRILLLLLLTFALLNDRVGCRVLPYRHPDSAQFGREEPAWKQRAVSRLERHAFNTAFHAHVKSHCGE